MKPINELTSDDIREVAALLGMKLDDDQPSLRSADTLSWLVVDDEEPYDSVEFYKRDDEWEICAACQRVGLQTVVDGIAVSKATSVDMTATVPPDCTNYVDIARSLLKAVRAVAE